MPPQISALQKGGDSFPLRTASGRVLGKALRSSDRSSKPVYVSVGHGISLDAAVRLTHSCCRHRVPEPIRQGGAAGLWGLLPSGGRYEASCPQGGAMRPPALRGALQALEIYYLK
ncbi:unnamed protein product [Menidia menidia]|uniref:(Atlantic silverside) hypothetical protein n=1 Tax=Menidia menidia TaxID=238744 RepID=A0A8S4BGF4_9TELE|nr:unnamed protein product [Menidia menidia]